MNTITRKSMTGDEPSAFADQAADSATSALRSTQGVANAAFDRLSDTIEGARDRAVPAIDRWSSQAESALRRSVDAVRDTSAQWRDKAAQVTDATAGRVRDEPLKAIVIAAVAGAVLMGLISLMGRGRDNR